MTKVADDVLGKVARQQADVFARICKGSLSPQRFFRTIRQLHNVFSLEVTHRHWQVAIEEGRYDARSIEAEFFADDLPPFEESRVLSEVCLRQADVSTTTSQWMEKCSRLAHPFQVLAVGYDEWTKDELQEGPILTLWKSPRTGAVWFLVIDYRGGKRLLKVDLTGPYYAWSPRCRVLVLSK